MNHLVCQFCGDAFTYHRKKKYCSDLCRNRKAHGVSPDYVAKQLTDEQRMENRRRLKREAKRRARRRAGATPRTVLAKRAAQKRQKAKLKRRRAVWRRLWCSSLESPAEYWRRKYKEDDDFNLRERMRRQVRKAQNRDRVGELIRGAIRRDGQSPTLEDLLGYSITDLRLHIERQFTKGMTWEKLKSGAIHIDHIVPQKEFDLSDSDEWQACWSMANLRPLWSRDNLRKGGTVETLL